MSCILVTGSSGYLGSNLVTKLQELGRKVIGLDLVAYDTTTIVGSFTDKMLLHKIVTEHNIDAICHVGGLHQPHIKSCTEEDFVNINIKGTLALLDVAKAHGIKKFLFTSTTSVFGFALTSTDQTNWITEETIPKPRNIYGVTKLAAENLCALYSREYGIHVITIRVSRFFPEEDSVKGTLSEENLKANEFAYRRITVNDAVLGHIKALDSITQFTSELFILSSSTPFSKEDVPLLYTNAPSVLESYHPDYKVYYNQHDWQFPQSLDRVYDSSKITKLLEFFPKVTFGWLVKNNFEDVMLIEPKKFDYEIVKDYKALYSQ